MENRRYVYAVRIYIDPANGCAPLAELAFGNGGRPNGETVTIRWDRIDEREKYIINSYTYIYDERPVVKELTFDEYIGRKEKK